MQYCGLNFIRSLIGCEEDSEHSTRKSHKIPYYKRLDILICSVALILHIPLTSGFYYFSMHVRANKDIYCSKWESYMSSERFNKMITSDSIIMRRFLESSFVTTLFAGIYLLFNKPIFKFLLSKTTLAKICRILFDLFLVSRAIRFLSRFWLLVYRASYGYILPVVLLISALFMHKYRGFCKRIGYSLFLLLNAILYYTLLTNLVIIEESYFAYPKTLNDINCKDAEQIRRDIRKFCDEFSFPEEKVYFDPDISSYSAWTAGILTDNRITITMGILENFDSDSVVGVFLHELGHVCNRSIPKLVGINLVNISLLFFAIILHSRGKPSKIASIKNFFLFYIIQCAYRIVGNPAINFLLSHREERTADQFAKNLGYGLSLKKFFMSDKKHYSIYTFDAPWYVNILSTHPNVLSRIRMLSD